MTVEQRPPRIYVAGRISDGNTIRNRGIRHTNMLKAIDVAEKIAEWGGCPFVPHLSESWDLVYPRDYEWWLAYDFQYIAVCDALYRMPEKSAGADREAREAHRLGHPIYFFLLDVHKFIQEWFTYGPYNCGFRTDPRSVHSSG